MADDPTGGVAVAGTANNREQTFTSGGALVAQWGIAGRGPGYVTRAGGVAIDAAGVIHVADTLASRVQRLGFDGAYLGQSGYLAASSGFVAPAAGDGQFNVPGGIAVDRDGGRVWVADTGNDRVQELGLDGGWRSTHAGFTRPRAVAVAPDGTVVVADTGADRLVRRDPATGAWSALAVTLSAPAGVAFAPDGTLWASDTGGDRVLRVTGAGGEALGLDVDGPTGLAATATDLFVADTGRSRVLRRSGAAWSVLGGEGRSLGAFVSPTGLAVDATARALVVADTGNGRLQAFSLDGGPLPTTSPPPQAAAPPSPPGPIAAPPPSRPAPRDRTAPRLRGARLSSRTLTRGRRVLTVRLDSSERATLRLSVTRRGRRIGPRAHVRPRGGPTRLRVPVRLLPRRPGSYRLTLVAVDPAGNRARALRLRFRVR